jgi:uncharacterized secreted protein with C-terminal beta-propeller domain
MQETEGSFLVFIYEMGNNILIFLSLLNWEKEVDQAIFTSFRFTSSLFRGKIAIHTHESCDSSHILVVESSNKVYHSWILRFGAHVKQDDKLRIEISAKAFEKPKMRRQFSTVKMFEAGK